jgi:cytosine/adenosine deaminase-related metal-dependent hydrolase
MLARDGVIIAVGQYRLPVSDGAAVIDASRRLLHPGLVNAHTHGHGHTPNDTSTGDAGKLGRHAPHGPIRRNPPLNPPATFESRISSVR